MTQLQRYVSYVRRGWWLVMLTAVAALGISITLSTLTQPQYRTIARFLVTPHPAVADQRDVIISLQALEKRSTLATYAEILHSQSLRRAAYDQLDVDPTALAAYQVTAVVLPEASVLELTVTGPDPQQAARLANAIGDQSVSYISSRYPVYEFTFLDVAPIVQTPFTPTPVRDAAVALVLGLAVGVGLALMLGQLRAPVALPAFERPADEHQIKANGMRHDPAAETRHIH